MRYTLKIIVYIYSKLASFVFLAQVFFLNVLTKIMNNIPCNVKCIVNFSKVSSYFKGQ